MSGLPIRTMQDVWTNTVDKFPRKAAAIWQDRAYSYAEIDSLAAAVATGLSRRFGLAKGDRLAVLAPNGLECFVLYWAAQRLGVTLVPINHRLRPDVIAFIVSETASRAVVVHREFAPLFGQIRAQCAAVEHVLAVECAIDGATAWADFASISADFVPPCGAISPDDICVIVYTSGTTGVPKGPVITHDNLIYNIRNTILPHSFRHEDVHMLAVPLFHCTGLNSIITTSAYLGSTVVLAPVMNVKDLVALIQKHRITTWLGVPTLFHFLTAMKDLAAYDLSSLRLIAYSGSPMPPETIRRLRAKFPGVKLHNFFGLTETISITNVLADCDADARPESIGKVLPEVGQKILDDAGREVPAGTVGELCFHRTEVIREYWNRPDLLPQSMAGDWFRTGDFALVDDDGYVYLKGRKKDMIIVGGENVYALEVENVLVSHGKVLEAAVVGVPATGIRSYLGELVKAVVVRREEGMDLTENDLRRFCSEKLASYQVPQIIEFRDALPRTPSGKVMKAELK